MAKKPLVNEETAAEVTPEVTEETAAEVTPEVIEVTEVVEEEVYISPATRAEMEAGKAALTKAAESAAAE